MNVAALISVLQGFPPEAELYYEDANFSGHGDAFGLMDIQLEGNEVIIHTPYWEPVE